MFADYLHDKITMRNLIPISEELSDYLKDGITDSNLQSQARTTVWYSDWIIRSILEGHFKV